MSRVAEFVELAVKALVDAPDAVRVVESEQRGSTLIEVFAAPSDVGKLIGRQGRTIAALRTLMALAGEQHGVKATLEIRD